MYAPNIFNSSIANDYIMHTKVLYFTDERQHNDMPLNGGMYCR